MNFIDRWIQKKVEKQLNIQLKASSLYQPGLKYNIDRGRIVAPVDNMTTYIRDGYSINDIIYAITNTILDKIRLPDWNLFKVVDESSLKLYLSFIARKNLSGKDLKKAIELKETSLEPISNFNLQAGKLKDLLTYPNDYCTFQDLVAEGILFKLLTGNLYWWADILGAGANAGVPNSIRILPSQHVTIKGTGNFPVDPISYVLYLWGKEFLPEQILHDKDPNPNWDSNGQELYGMSPLKAALKNLNRNNSAKDAATAKFQNGGAEGVMYFDNPMFQPGEGKQQIQAVKAQWADEYSGPINQGKKVVSGYKMGYIPIGLSPVDLAIIDSEKWDALMFCNIYNVPPVLLNLAPMTYNNLVEADKALTLKAAMPHLISLRNSLNRKLTGNGQWGFKGQNIFADFNTQCFTELNVNISEVVNTTSKMIAVTPNEEREEMGWSKRPEPEMDEVWVLQAGSRVPLSDFQANQIDAQLMQDALQNGNTQANQQNGNGKVSEDRQGKTGLRNGNGAHVSFAKSI